jgi:glycosyltransferase involved in cell wall biosynthesis
MPEVAVIIPTYNRANTILRAVASALAQTHQDLEVLVVDDGSSDNTLALLNNISDRRLRVLQHSSNRGAAAARNMGIAAADNRYIAWLDSDDAWHPLKLEIQLDRLRSASCAEAVSCHAVLLHLLDHGVDRVRTPAQSACWQHSLLLNCDLSPGSTMLARRDAFETTGLLDETLSRFEDWDWLLRYATLGGSIALLPEVLAEVWNRRGRLGRQHEDSARRFIAKHSGLYAALSETDRRQGLCDIWLQVSGTYFFEGEYGQALRAALRGATQRPFHTSQRLLSHCLRRLKVQWPVGTL